MKYRVLILLSTLLLNLNAFGQELLQSFDLPFGAKWLVNGKGDFLYVHKNQVVLQSSDGRVLKQSIKSVGEIEQFEMVNTLKYLLFSYEQQMVCFFDNSLSNMDDCLDLDEMGFVQVTKVASSAQSDKLWIYDEVNSNLVMYALNGQIQMQQISNLKGMLNMQEVSEIMEMNNRLIILDQSKGIYFFDQFGTFLQFAPLENVQHIEMIDKFLLILKDKKLFQCKVEIDGEIKLNELGFDAVETFRFNGESLFIQIGNKVEKYRF